MKNRISDLNNLLFEQIENIMNPEETMDVKTEIAKGKAIAKLSEKIIDIGNLQLQAMKAAEALNLMPDELPALLTDKREVNK